MSEYVCPRTCRHMARHDEWLIMNNNNNNGQNGSFFYVAGYLLYPVYTTNRRRAGLVNAHQLVRFRQLFAFTLQQREQD